MIARMPFFRKINDLLESGVGMVWIIDPQYRTVTVYRVDRPVVVYEEGHEITGDDILPGLRCPVSDFFRLPGEQPKQPPSP